MIFCKRYKKLDGGFKCYGHTLIEYCGNDEIVHIPEGIRRVGDMAFRRTPENTKVIYLPSSCKKIGVAAFAYCPSLEYVNGDNVREIYEYAFWNCKKLKKVSFPKLKRYYNEAFSGNSASVHMSSKTKTMWLH